MRNGFLILALWIAVAASAQDTLSEPLVDTTTIMVDTLDYDSFSARIPEDTSAFHPLNTRSAAPVHFDRDFKSRYDSDAFNYEERTPDKSLWQRFLDWLARKLSQWFDVKDAETSANILKYVGWTLLILVALGTAYLIARILLRREGRWIFAKSADSGLRYDEMVGNIERTDFDELIRRALVDNDLRLATRYQYLRLLRELSRRGIIEFDKEKTNSEYAYEIREEALRKRFQYLSYLYNYIWYGKFDVDESTYAKTASAFQETITKLV